MTFTKETAAEKAREMVDDWYFVNIQPNTKDLVPLIAAALSAAYEAGVMDEREILLGPIKQTAALLDGIKYELYASVYTLVDDEFETTFWCRDILLEAVQDAEIRARTGAPQGQGD